MRREVVITGIGVICSQAMSAQETFLRLRNKQSSVRNHPRYSSYGFPNPACAYVDEAVWRQLRARHEKRSCYPMGPHAHLAAHAADEAVAQSDIAFGKVDRKGLFVASNKYTLTEQQLLALARHYDDAVDRVDLDAYLRAETHEPSSYFHKRQDMAALALADHFGFDDIVTTQGDACAAGGMAIGSGYRSILHGELDVALCGATEASASYMMMLMFTVLGALSQNATDRPETISRPFDKDRSGFVLGEGSAFLVLESLEHARLRGATILAEVSGFSRQTEAWKITASPPDGTQYARCMRAAIADAGMVPDDIDHINAHGTSTQANDSCEGAAISLTFGERASQIPVTSNKSALGHSLAACGVIEAAMSVLSLQTQTLLPTLNFNEGDAATAALNVVKNAQEAKLDHIISNSFGFGSENCSLVLSRLRSAEVGR